MMITQNSLRRVFCRLRQVLAGTVSRGESVKELVNAAIQQAVDNTDPLIRMVPGYKRQLRPAVVRAMNYAESLVDEMPSAIVIDSDSFSTDPRLRQFFTSTTDMWKVLGNCVNATCLHGNREWSAPWLYALLTMQKEEKSTVGAEVVGDIVLRDALRQAVSFESHQLIDPSESEVETRRKLKKRAFEHLLSLALHQITIIKSERKNLQQCRALLQSKLRLMKRTGRGFQQFSAAGQTDVESIEELAGKIDAELLELGGDDRMLEVHLDIVAGVLGRPAEHLRVRKERLILDRMGIRHPEAVEGSQEVILDIVSDSDGLHLVCLPVAIRKDAFLSG